MSIPSMHRRRWLALAGASACGAAFFDAPAVLARAGFAPDDPFGGWPLGVQTYSLREFPFVEAVRHIQGMGIHFVECFPRHFPIDAADDVLRDNQAILKKAQIQLAGYGVVEFTRDHEANRRMFEQARRAGVRNITANPQPDSFESLERLVAEFDIRIAIHNHGPGALYDSIESVTRAVEKRHKWIGACIDTGHFLRSKEDPVRAVRELGKRVFALHIKDEARQEKDSHNVVIGRGHLDVVGLFQALKEVGFPADGDLALEYEANPANPIDDMKACLDVAREAIQKVAKA